MPDSPHNGSGVMARLALLERGQSETFQRLREVDRLAVSTENIASDVSEMREETKLELASIKRSIAARDKETEQKRQFTWGQGVAVAVAFLLAAASIVSALINAGAG